ncbi:MAG: SDR family NAD(P)-dependent oxidoreductase [Bacteroidales bacterium]|nr:SDR family NAD(P)-dependent oxidoreductase [Bacteroidales bacterium]
MKDIKGYNALVTGGTSGMGWEYCQQLAALGCNVLMVSNQQQLLDTLPNELADKYGVHSWGLCIDLA